MAYSDYGGYAFRNGERIVDRSDCTITPEGDTFGTPGIWPGFGMILSGETGEEVKKKIQWPHGHAVLGDGPIYVVLYKQTTVTIYRGPEKLDGLGFVVDLPEKAVSSYEYEGKVRRYIDTDWFANNDRSCVFAVDGCRIEVHWSIEDNHYQYVRMEQPDGTVWCGWSGYGVGAGLEDCGYGYSTEDRNDVLASIWPDAIKEAAA